MTSVGGLARSTRGGHARPAPWVRRCPDCDREHSEEARFCSWCGTVLDPPGRRADDVRKTVSVVFCDVTGSTELGERLDPESLRLVMARYFDATRTVLERHGGTIEKFIGDAVV